MQKNATTRSIDDLGRIVIPVDIRESFGWGAGTKLEVAISNIAAKTITIREFSPCCSLCWAQPENLTPIEKGYVCEQCLARIK